VTVQQLATAAVCAVGAGLATGGTRLRGTFVTTAAKLVRDGPVAKQNTRRKTHIDLRK